MESLPVAGGSKERLTRQATGPSLTMRTAGLLPCCCVLSNCTVTPSRLETAQPGIGSAAVGALRKSGLSSTASGKGVRKAMARAPSR